MTKLEYEQRLEKVEAKLKTAKLLNIKNNRFLMFIFATHLTILFFCFLAVYLNKKNTLEIVKCEVSSIKHEKEITDKNYNNEYKIDVYRNTLFDSVSEVIYSFKTIEEARNAAEIIGCKW